MPFSELLNDYNTSPPEIY